jgi:hypothetical protein
MLYLAGKDDDLLDNSSGLFLKELLDDVATNGTRPGDGEVCISRHEVTLSTVRVILVHRHFASSLYTLSEPSIICHTHRHAYTFA